MAVARNTKNTTHSHEAGREQYQDGDNGKQQISAKEKGQHGKRNRCDEIAFVHHRPAHARSGLSQLQRKLVILQPEEKGQNMANAEQDPIDPDC